MIRHWFDYAFEESVDEYSFLGIEIYRCASDSPSQMAHYAIWFLGYEMVALQHHDWMQAFVAKVDKIVYLLGRWIASWRSA